MNNENLLKILTGKTKFDPKKLTPEEIAEVLESIQNIDKLASEIRASTCKYLKENTKVSIPGWKVRPGGCATSITNTVACSVIMEKDYGMELSDFVKLCSVSFSKLQEEVLKTSSGAEEDIITKLRENLSSVLKSTQRADTITKAKTNPGNEWL